MSELKNIMRFDTGVSHSQQGNCSSQDAHTDYSSSLSMDLVLPKWKSTPHYLQPICFFENICLLTNEWKDSCQKWQWNANILWPFLCMLLGMSGEGGACNLQVINNRDYSLFQSKPPNIQLHKLMYDIILYTKPSVQGYLIWYKWSQ